MNSATATPAGGRDPDETFDVRIRELLNGAAATYDQRIDLDERLATVLAAAAEDVPGPAQPGS